MPGNSFCFTPKALDLLLNAVETPEASISGAVLDDFHASESIVLKETGLLKSHGHEEVSVSGADHDDAPVTLSWSAEDGGLGYFSPTAGWINVPEDRIARFRVDFPVLLTRLMVQADVSSRSGPTPLIPDLLWEIGDVRLGRRRQRVPIWFVRRLHERSVWRQIKDMAKARPITGLRVVLTSTPSNRLPDEAISGHLLVGIRDVIDFASGLAVHSDILAARLDGSHQPGVQEAVYLSPDGRKLVINGTITIYFKTDKQIKIIGQLVAGFQEGKRFSVQELLTEAGSGATGLRRAFGAKKWDILKHHLKSSNGLWGFEL